MDVAAVVGLTLLSIGQEMLFGADGLMLRAVPYAAAQDYLEVRAPDVPRALWCCSGHHVNGRGDITLF